MIKTWRLDTEGQTLVLASFAGDLAEVIYWAGRLPEGEDCATLAAQTRQSTIGAMLDKNPALSVCPSVGHPGLIVSDPQGNELRPEFVFKRENSYSLTAPGLDLEFSDEALELTYHLIVKSFGEVFSTHAKLISAAPIHVSWLAAPAIPAPTCSDRHITFTGRWCQEFQRVETPWRPGVFSNAAPGGRTSHEFSPGIFVPSKGATETAGEVWAAHLGWSGGHKLVAEELPDGRRQIQMGHHGALKSAPCQSPILHLTHSSAGLSGASQNYHKYLRDHVLDFPNSKSRPVHYNCWEAVYFDHEPAQLMNLAEQAADLGVERFVLDDGWFGARDDDTSSLGDWTIDPRKWPNGLTPLIDHVHALGMSFGLWFEPEMINENSDLYRRHPDWVLGPVDQVRGRNQLVLDMARDEVREYLFKAISEILNTYSISYIKWDHNRPLPYAQEAQTLGIYKLLDALRAAHPIVEIETCSSGGGRVDFEILKRTHRFWASDSNDAKARWDIQRGASYFFPPEITGAHVGPDLCHTSGRQFPLNFRSQVAATRTMGLEMDLATLDSSARKTLRADIAHYKSRREILHQGQLTRLDSDDPNVSAEMHHKDDSFLVFVAQLEPSAHQLTRPLRLANLKPEAQYHVILENPEAAPVTMNREYTNPIAEGVVLTGAALMSQGITLPQAFPDTIWVLTGTLAP